MQNGGKPHVSQNTIWSGFGVDWLREQHLRSDWPGNVERVFKPIEETLGQW